MYFNNLPGHVWPRTAKREEDGVVTIAGVPLPDLVEEFGSPLFVIDEDDFRSRCRDMAAAFGAENVHYASKAFLSKTVAQWVDEEGLSLDVASPNELGIALAAGFPASRITVHGNNKSASFLQSCVDNEVGAVVLDNAAELEMLDLIAAKSGKTQTVLVRVKPGVEAHTHEMIATAHEDQKFGFSLASGSAYEAAAAAINAENLQLIGLHCHVGSQVFDAEGFALAAERVLGLMGQLHEAFGDSLFDSFTILDLGGGYGIAYTADQQPLNVAEVAEDLITKVEKYAAAQGVPTPRVMVEPGRAIAGPSTVTVYEVGMLKDVHVDDTRTRRYIAVDGGMSDNIRPALYDAEYDARVVNRFVDGEPIPTRVVGSHCESGDILISDAQYPNDIETGDLLALAATGAYCYAMSSRYNQFARPAVVAVRGGRAKLMLRRETLEDILALEG